MICEYRCYNGSSEVDISNNDITLEYHMDNDNNTCYPSYGTKSEYTGNTWYVVFVRRRVNESTTTNYNYPIKTGESPNQTIELRHTVPVLAMKTKQYHVLHPNRELSKHILLTQTFHVYYFM